MAATVAVQLVRYRCSAAVWGDTAGRFGGVGLALRDDIGDVARRGLSCMAEGAHLGCVRATWGQKALPKNGGEKNYLEYLFRKPKFLITSVFASNAVLLAWATGNSLVLGEYILLAADIETTRWTLRLVGFACITFALLLHGLALQWNLRLQNFLGLFQILVLVFIVFTGFVALGGHMKVDKPHNFTNAFEGTTASASSFYNVCH
ncbi:hypothetical protein HYPSUDRAFT_200296 [Hypholoma sublateritium FD-334 SS-4]|uniref:Uncharacterized protein n=1 Tax=Hypholoma sublateritium (strain FD-334 SS-4) TaxID=945553 RepID=A0A0D2PZH8_HYPSF|nr:hypothetical protein HYPSUDRAFT_200296 [Hypholoma sublateritium FD-334 SS-4]